MQAVVVFGLALAAIVGLAAAAPPDKYTTRYDNINLDQILSSDRLLRNYLNCLLDKGKCSPDGSELKRVLHDALETDCSKCNEKQKKNSEKAITFLINNKRDHWDQLVAKYDPSGLYRSRHPEAFKS